MTVGGCCAKGRLTLLPKAVMPCVRLSGRIAILRIVADQAGLSFSELEKATGFPAATLRRQLGVLIEAGVIATSENAAGSRTYLVGLQSVNLSFVLVSLALDGRLKP